MPPRGIIDFDSRLYQYQHGESVLRHDCAYIISYYLFNANYNSFIFTSAIYIYL